MTTTLRPTSPSPSPAADGAGLAPGASRPRWPLFGLAGAVAGLAAVLVSFPERAEDETQLGISVVDDLTSGGYRIGFLLGLVSIGCLLVAAQGWRRWAEVHAPGDLAARTIGAGLAVTATVNVVFTGIMGAMALYLPGGAEEDLVSREHLHVNFVLLDFGILLGWWGAAVSAVAVAVLALGRSTLLPRWMGVVSVVFLLPPVLLAVLTGLPGFVGLTLPLWLVVVSVGMVVSRRAAGAPAAA